MTNTARLVVLVGLLASLLPSSARAASPADWSLSNGHFFGQTAFAVRDDENGRFWTEFRTLGGVGMLGYPVSRPYLAGGLHYQAFQRAILQWRPELGRALLANTLDLLSEMRQDDWLDGLGIPRPLGDSGGTWDQVVAQREGWLTSTAIARHYRAVGGMDRFGLPQSLPERRGPFTVQRFQRAALQLWHDSVPGMPAPGSVVGVLVGDLAKAVHLVPAEATMRESGGNRQTEDSGDTAAYRSTAEAEAEQIALNLINRSRQEHGLAPVQMDKALQGVARSHARDMAARGFFAHVTPEGQHSYDRLNAAGIPFSFMGENLGWGRHYPTPADAVRANHGMMMAETPPEDGHRRIILNSRLRKVGVGVVLGADGCVYYVADFTD